MSITFDHLVLLVNDLDVAARDFTALGFTVFLVSFADGSYILLTAFTSAKGIKGHRLEPVMDGGERWGFDQALTPWRADPAGAELI